MRVEMTDSGTSMLSASAMDANRVDVDASSNGLKRNLEHLEARGSIILRSKAEVCQLYSDKTSTPCNVVTN